MINILKTRQTRLENSSNVKNKQAAGKYLRMPTIRNQSPLFPIRVIGSCSNHHIAFSGCVLLNRATCNYNLQNILIPGINYWQKESSAGSSKTTHLSFYNVESETSLLLI